MIHVQKTRGNFRFDKTKPDGTPRKLLNVEKINNLGWKAKTDLKTGIQFTFKDFLISLKN